MAYTDQPEIQYETLESSLQYGLSKHLTIGAGGKYNKVMNGEAYWGGKGLMMLEIKGMGRLQVQYEKSYLPTLQHNLYAIEIGRVSWIKSF